jgi:uncharacterized membrane protein YgcG
MKRQNPFILPLAVAIAGLAVVGVSRGADQSATTQPVAQPTGVSALSAIEQAGSPSAAISAFGKALGSGLDNAATYSAFVHRMAQLGMPQAAFEQAQTAVRLNRSDGVAWAVIAFTQAGAGQAEQALSALVKAVPLAGDDPFVVRTAGQLIAWYDGTPDLAVSAPTIKAVQEVRRHMAGNELYTETYRTTMEALQFYDAARSQNAGTNVTAPPEAQAEPYTAPLATEPSPTITYAEPPATYGVYPYDYVYPYYVTPYVYSPGFLRVYVTEHYRHHEFGRDRDRGGDIDVHHHWAWSNPITIHAGKVTPGPWIGRIGERPGLTNLSPPRGVWTHRSGQIERGFGGGVIHGGHFSGGGGYFSGGRGRH